MPKFAANLNWLFTDLPMLDRFDATSKAGFKAVEYMFPFDYDINGLVGKLRSLNLIQVLFNMPPGDRAAGDRGLGCLPDHVDEFRASVQTAIDAANELNCPTVNCLSGIPAPGSNPALLEQTFVDNLRYAAAEFAKYDIYHMQVMEGDLANTLATNLHHIGHLQLADNPGRHEPGTGEINYPFLLRHIDAIGYEGWIGCKYKPIGDTVAGLGWMKEMN